MCITGFFLTSLITGSPTNRRVRECFVSMKKRKADGSPPQLFSPVVGDRLSDLPDDLIGRIISFLPTPQAVLTSQLSRRWRRVWAHVGALNVCVRGCVRRHRSYVLASEALARFPTPGIPSISVEIDGHVHATEAWYREAMERAVGSVRVTSLRELASLELPPCTRAEALAVTSPGTVLALPDPAAGMAFGRLAELSLSAVQLSGAARPLGEFLSSCCPRLRRLRLCCVSGDAVRRLALRTDALEALDVNNVGDLTRLDVVAANLRRLSVRSCFRFPTGGEVSVKAPRMEAILWYRSYPKQLDFGGDMTHVRRLAGLKLPALGRPDQFDAPYAVQLLHKCSLAEHLAMELVMPDEMALLNWLGPEQGACEDLIRHVPQLPNVSVLSLKLSWGFGGNIGPSLASLLSRAPSLTRLRIDASPYCFTVTESKEAAPPPCGEYQWGHSRKDGELRLDRLREVSVDGLKGTDCEEYRVLELLLGSVPTSLERLSLTFCGTAASIFDKIATEIPKHFPMAAGRWDRCPPSVLTWSMMQGKNSQAREAKKLRTK
ncbi:hypothetical protein ACP70R_007176 [Stipagrostis hirtigluma subsp. patula]